MKKVQELLIVRQEIESEIKNLQAEVMGLKSQ